MKSMLNINRKYNNYYTYNDGIIYDLYNKPIPKNNIIYKIIEKYNDMIHYLTDIKIIPYNSIKKADEGLIYKGYDKKGKEQYKYGNEYIINRKRKKIITFLKVYKKINIIQEIINIGLNESCINKIFLFSVILLLELTFYIRLGKDIHYKNNNTIGLLTFQKKHLLIKENEIIINFVGKTRKNQIFYCNKDKQPILYNVLLKLYNQAKNNNDYIFTTCDNIRFTERMLNNKLKKINLRLKDFRTYGVNIILIEKIYENIINKNNINIIKQSIKETADYIGHTQNISKKSYLSEELQALLINILESKNKPKNFNSFLNFIVNKLEILSNKYEKT